MLRVFCNVDAGVPLPPASLCLQRRNKMRKWLIAPILFVAFVCGGFVYMEWDKRRFAASLPKPPPVEQQSVDTYPHPHDHPHPHEDPVPATPTNAHVFETQTILIENSISPQTSEEDTAEVETEEETFSVEESVSAWQTDDEHEHKSTQDPFAKKITQLEDMDPDEYADMILVGLLEKFGDIPEVHTFTEFTRKIKKNEELTLDERIEFTRAQYTLWPHPETKKSLEIFLEERAIENRR